MSMGGDAWEKHIRWKKGEHLLCSVALCSSVFAHLEQVCCCGVLVLRSDCGARPCLSVIDCD